MRLIGLLQIIGIAILILLVFQEYIWSLSMGLLMALMGWETFDKQFIVISFLGNSVVLYLIIGVMTQAVLVTYTHDDSFGWLVFYSAVCSLFILGLVSQSLVSKNQGNVYKDEAAFYGTNWQVKLDTAIALAAIPFFILSLVVPSIAINPLTDSLFRLVLWVAGIPVLGIVLAVGGGLLALYLCWSGVIRFLGAGYAASEGLRKARRT